MNRLLELEKELARFSGRGTKPNAPAPVAPVEPSVSAAQSYGGYNYAWQNSGPAEEIRVLSIDGGGLRGIIPATILDRIEQLIGERLKAKGKADTTDLAIQDYFDAFAGTSTGSIISAGLLIPNRSKVSNGRKYEFAPKEFIKVYQERGKEIFSPEHYKKRTKGELRLALSHNYDRSGVDKVLEEYLGRNANGKGLFFHELLKPLLVVSVEYMTGAPAVFKNWEKAVFRAVDVIRASTAAPTYFDPVGFQEFDPSLKIEDMVTKIFSEKNGDLIGNIMTTMREAGKSSIKVNPTKYYVDGGIFRNNPAGLILNEVLWSTNIFAENGNKPYIAKTPHRISPDVTDPSKVIMLSLGTGDSNSVNKLGKRIAIKEVGNVIAQGMAANTAMEEEFVRTRLSAQNYFRFNPPIPEEASDMDNPDQKHLENLEKLTLRYLDEPEVKQQLDRLVTKLVGA